MGHNRAEVRRLSVLAAREAGARARKSGPVPVRVSRGRCPFAQAWSAPARLPGGSAVLASRLGETGLSARPKGVLPGRFGPSQSLCRMCYEE